MEVIGMPRYELERNEQWREKICVAAPYFEVPANCTVQIIPPFAGAVARMRFKREDREVSLYLDWYDALGFVGQPYFEIWPDENGDNARFLLGDTAELTEAIDLALNATPKEAI